MKYSSHNTYLNKKGEEVPSVTTVIKILNKPFLTKWANIMGFKRKKIEDILERSSAIGTLVHKAIEAYLMKKKFYYFPERHHTRELLLSYLNYFIDWQKSHKVEPIMMEAKLSTDKYGGTIDFYGKVDDKFTILDFKTSKKFYSTMFLQLGAYYRMLTEQGYEVEQAAIIIVNENKYKEKFIDKAELEEYAKAFDSLSNVFHLWYDLNKEKGWGDILV